MRILTSVLLILVACGLVVYSYIGAYVKLVRDMDSSETLDEVSGSIFQLIEYLLSGGAPQLTGFLYLGLLLFAVAIVNLIMRPKNNDS